MGKLSGTEKLMLAVSIIVLIACTVLAFLLGYVTDIGHKGIHRKDSVATQTECPPCPEAEGCSTIVQPEKLFKRQDLTSTTPKYNYVVSIIVKMYVEDEDNYMYVCSGVVISDSQVLTGVCGGDPDILDMLVRCDSQYWHTGGTTHQIASVKQPEFKDSGLYVLEIKPLFPLSVLPAFPALGEKWTTAKTVGWIKDPKKPTRTIQLDSTAADVTVEEISCDGPNCEKVGEKCDDSDIGHPLVTEDRKLVGIVSGRGCFNNTYLGFKDKHRFTDMTSSIYGRWLSEEVKVVERRMAYNRG